MPCDTKLKRNQTISQRKAEVKKAVEKFQAGLISGKVKVKIGPSGSVAFDGITELDRDGVTDACAYRRIMALGSPLAKAKLEAGIALTGKQVNVHGGSHSHDGGNTWHPSHKH